MYGYVRIMSPELKLREYDTYRGVYCSLCRELGRRYSVGKRLLLSYDMTFFALVLLSLGSEDCRYKKGRCPFNLAKRCSYLCSDSEALSVAADLSILMAWYKLRDNIADGSFIERMQARLLCLWLRRSYKKAAGQRPQADRLIKTAMQQQAYAEAQAGSIDFYSHPSAECLKELLALFAPQSDSESAGRLGYFIGRWVYLADALDDLKRDLKKGRFNPYIIKYSIKTTKEADERLDCIMQDLNLSAAEAAEAFESLNTNRYRGIIDNIIYDGLYNRMLQIKEGWDKA